MPAETSCDRSASCVGLGVAATTVLSTDSTVCFRAAVPGLSEADAPGLAAPGVVTGAALGVVPAVRDGIGDEAGVLADTTGAGGVQPATSPATSKGTASSKTRLPAAWRRPDGFRGVPLLITRPFCHAARYPVRRMATAEVRGIY